jgi:hypothetical protein
MTTLLSRRTVMGAAVGYLVGGKQQAATEPTYTITLPDKQTFALQVAVRKGADGSREVRVFTRPTPTPGPLYIENIIVADPDGKPSRCRLFFGTKPRVGMTMEAVRNPKGDYSIRVPEEKGTLNFGAPLFTPLAAELFVGRMYDWRRGGPQNFAQLVDYGAPPVSIVTLTLTADGQETITLPSGEVKARKLKYKAAVPHLPKEQQEGVFWVGPLGEVLKCDTPFFGVPLRAQKPAVYDKATETLTLTFANPGDAPGTHVALYARKRGTIGYTLALEFEKGMKLATLECDTAFRPTTIETPWFGRTFHADISGSTLRYSLAETPVSVRPAPTGNVWFPPSRFVTELWEGEKGVFAGMAVGEKRDGDYLGVVPNQTDEGPFILERLPDVTARTPEGEEIAVRHYRQMGKQSESKVELGIPLQMARPVYHLYTDGARLIAFLGTDKVTVFRDGWDAFTKTLKV